MKALPVYPKRRTQLLTMMEKQAIDCTIVCNSPNLFYMTGYLPKKCERLQIALFPLDSEPILITPALYLVNAEQECCITDLRVWTDGDDLTAFVKNVLAEKNLINKTYAIDDTFEFRQLYPIQQASPNSQLVPGSNVFTELRMRKSPKEVELMAVSGALSDEAMGMLVEQLLSGRSESELKSWIEFELLKRGMSDGFSNLIASGPNCSAPHHVSGSRMPQRGDAVYLDIGGAYQHYWSDITRSLHIGKPSDRYVEIYKIVREAQQLAFESIKPGIRACDVDKVARDYLAKHNLDFIHRLGHGEGLEGHELPNLAKDCGIILEPGMTFSCEPGVYFSGEFGIRIEDTVCVTETGVISFNHYTKDLIIL